MAAPEVVTHIREVQGDALTATSQLNLDANIVRAEPPQWKSYLQTGLITQNDYNVVVSYEQMDATKRREIFANGQHAAKLVETLTNLMSNVNKVPTVKYVLVMVDDALYEDIDRVRTFWQTAAVGKQSVFAPFLLMLTRDDGFLVHMAGRIISKLACTNHGQMTGNELMNFMHHLKEQLRAADNAYIQSAARCIQQFLRFDHYRRAFATGDGIPTIVSVLSGKANFQMQYQLVFCLWCLSFSEEIATRMQRHGVVPTLADILSDTTKEKVQRMILATFRNLVTVVSDTQVMRDNALQMVQCKVLKTLELLAQRKHDDEELNDDIEFLTEKLIADVQDLSSFDEYCTELRSGRLLWSPVHKSDKFWRENATRFNEAGFQVVKMLIRLLEVSEDPLVLAVAAHDVGEYVRHYPRGKTVLEQLHGKTQVMKLLTHADPNVRYHALLAVQKLMVHNWEYLGKQVEEPGAQKNPMAAMLGGIKAK